MRLAALLIATALAVPAVIALTLPRRSGRPEDRGAARSRLETVWAAVPVVLLVALGVLAAAA